MPGRQHDQLIAVLETAANEPIGIVVVTNDPVRCRAALYRARMAENNPRYADLQFRMWPYDDGDLVICHEQTAPAPKPATNLGEISLSGILDLDLE